MDELIQTPYGEVRAEGLQELQASFDTRQILTAVDEIDSFCTQWKRELRDDLLRVHAMAHTVINGAPLTSAAGEESLTEAAYSLASEFRDWQQSCDRLSLCSTTLPNWRPIRARFGRFGVPCSSKG